MTSSGYRKTRQIIWVLAAVVAAAGGLSAIALICWPLAQAQPELVITAPAVSKADANERPSLTIADFSDALSKYLQRPLEEPPPPKPVEVVAVAPPTPVIALPEVQLLGTAHDSQTQYSMAWLQVPGQPVLLVGLGQIIKGCPGEPVVAQIEAGSATLKFGERELQLKVKKVPLVH